MWDINTYKIIEILEKLSNLGELKDYTNYNKLVSKQDTLVLFDKKGDFDLCVYPNFYSGNIVVSNSIQELIGGELYKIKNDQYGIYVDKFDSYGYLNIPRSEEFTTKNDLISKFVESKLTDADNFKIIEL